MMECKLVVLLAGSLVVNSVDTLGTHLVATSDIKLVEQ
jgi:hypothetical protein